MEPVTHLIRASPFLLFRGTQILRIKGFVRPNLLTCPDGHGVKEKAIIREDGALWCTYRASPHQGECGALLYVMVIPGRGSRRRLWAADVTKSELDQMETLRLDADGVLAYFGAGFTR